MDYTELIKAVDRLQDPVWFKNPQIYILFLQVIVTIILSYLIYNQNKEHKEDNEKLQKQIQNMNVQIALYDKILDIYYIFTESGYLLIPQNLNNIITEKYIKEIDCYKTKMFQAYNHAKLLFHNEEELIEKMKNILGEYLNLVYNIKEHFKNSNIKNLEQINVQLEKYNLLLSDKNFDIYFEKYLKLKEFD